MDKKTEQKKSSRRHRCLFLVSSVCVSATGRSHFQRNPTDCGVSLSVIQCSCTLLHVPWNMWKRFDRNKVIYFLFFYAKTCHFCSEAKLRDSAVFALYSSQNLLSSGNENQYFWSLIGYFGAVFWFLVYHLFPN